MCSHILLAGSSHPTLSRVLSRRAQIPLGSVHIETFPDGETFVQVQADLKNKTVHILQSLFPDPNQKLMELLLLVDAVRHQSPCDIHLVMPYYGYGRQDRINEPGRALGAKLVAQLLMTAGVEKATVLDLHSEEAGGFFDIPVQHVMSRKVFIPLLQTLDLEQGVVLAPDKGAVKLASAYAHALNLPLAFIDKRRLTPYQVSPSTFLGDVKEKIVIIPDDICSTGSTLIQAAELAMAQGATRLLGIVGHGLFTHSALERLEESPFERIWTTDSVAPHPDLVHAKKISIHSIASLLM